MAIDVAVEPNYLDEPAPAERGYDTLETISSYSESINNDDNGIRSMVADALGVPEYTLPPAALAAPDNRAMNNRIELAKPTAEPEIIMPRFSASRTVLNGLKRRLEIIRNVASDKFAVAVDNLSDAASSVKERTKAAAEWRPSRKTVVLGLGTVALTGVTLAAAYVESRGLVSVSAIVDHLKIVHDHAPKEVNTSHLQEPLKQVAPPKTHIPVAKTVQSGRLSDHLQQALHPASNSRSVAYHPHKTGSTLPVAHLRGPGDTVWNHVHERVQAKFQGLSAERVNELTNKFKNQTLKLNHLDSWKAMHMKIGATFRLPGALR